MTIERPNTSLTTSEISKLMSPLSPVGIDLDGVIVNSVERTLSTLNARLKTNFTLEDITHSYRLDDLYRDATGCTQEEASLYLTSIWNSRECMEEAKPISGAIELLNHFDNEIGLKYHFVTSRPASVRTYTENWFTKNGLGKHFIRAVMQSSDKYNKHHKIDVIRGYGIKIFFEDMAEHADAIIKNTDAIVVLVNYPANQNLPDHPRIVRPQSRTSFGNIQASYLALLDYLVNRQNLRV